MVVTYSYIMKIKKKEIEELKDEIIEYLMLKRKMILKLKKKLAEAEIMVNDVERKLKMVGVNVHKL